MIPRAPLLHLVSALLLLQTLFAAGQALPERRLLVLYRDGSLPALAEAKLQTAGSRLLRRHDRFGIAVVAGVSGAALAALRADPEILAIVPDREVTASALQIRPASENSTVAPSADSLYRSPQGWAVRLSGGFGDASHPGPWSYTRGEGVRIAILDSGIDAGHPDLAPNLILNRSEIDQSAATGLPSLCDDGSAQDQTGHGTWTASLAAGAFGAGTGLVAGVAPSASLLNIKVLERLPAATLTAADPTGCRAGQAAGLLSWVLAGIDDAIAQHADIINLSLGTTVDLTTGEGAGLQALFNRVTYAATQAGAILIAAAGNDGIGFGAGAEAGRYLELPAQSRGVLAIVAATNPACAENLRADAVCTAGPVTLPYYSNYGPALNALAAPGGSYPAGAVIPDPAGATGWIAGACSAGGAFGCFNLGASAYVQAMGTSASAALATGAAALVRAAYPAWTAAQIIQSLRESAVAAPGLPVPMVAVPSLLQPATRRAVPVISAPVQGPVLEP
jgi:subtilisin family serine protease